MSRCASCVPCTQCLDTSGCLLSVTPAIDHVPAWLVRGVPCQMYPGLACPANVLGRCQSDLCWKWCLAARVASKCGIFQHVIDCEKRTLETIQNVSSVLVVTESCCYTRCCGPASYVVAQQPLMAGTAGDRKQAVGICAFALHGCKGDEHEQGDDQDFCYGQLQGPCRGVCAQQQVLSSVMRDIFALCVAPKRGTLRGQPRVGATVALPALGTRPFSAFACMMAAAVAGLSSACGPDAAGRAEQTEWA
jgi:hypothetical protein